jgi:hypothetical protein
MSKTSRKRRTMSGRDSARDPPDARLGGGRRRALGLGELPDSLRLRSEERRPRDEGDREEDEADHDPVVAEAPEVGVDDHEDAADDGEEGRGHDQTVADPLDVAAERDLAGGLARAEDPEGEELDHHGAADPDRCHRDVHEQQELVPGHGTP